MKTIPSQAGPVLSVFRFLIGLVLFAAPLTCGAQARSMPVLVAKTLNGQTVDLPSTADGKPIVLVFGFGRSSKNDGETWGKELVSMYLEKRDFDFYQIAMLDGAPRFTHGLITRAIRASVPSAYYSHMLVLTDNGKAWRDVLDVADEESTYVVLCSPAGEIQWETRGTGPAQFDALRAHLRKIF